MNSARHLAGRYPRAAGPRRPMWPLAAALLLAGTGCCAQAPTAGGPSPAPPGAGGKSGGQAALNITVPTEGEHFVRFLPSPDAKKPAPLPVRFTDRHTTVTYDPAVLGSSPRVAVDDARTGNSAILPLSARAVRGANGLELVRPDFYHVREVDVRVTYDNRPVQVAQVTLTGPDGKAATYTIDASKQGAAIFEDVPAGKAKLTVVYGDKFTEAKDVAITVDHAPGPVVVPAAVTNKVPTLEPSPQPAPAPPAGAPAPGAVPGAPAGPPAQGGGLAGFIGSILGLAVAGGAMYLLYRWAQTGGMAATLKKVGIEVSGPAVPSDAGTPWQPNAPTPPVVSDPSLCQYCGQKKDAAGNCACALGAGMSASPGAVPSPAVPSQPRLVGTVGIYSGSTFPLHANGTGMTVGRDAACAIALPDDTTVSRRHAAIRADGGTYLVSDEGSSNGVYVNGVRIQGSQALRPGDEVQIGNTRFRFEV
jgi:hypothetical protein